MVFVHDEPTLEQLVAVFDFLAIRGVVPGLPEVVGGSVDQFVRYFSEQPVSPVVLSAGNCCCALVWFYDYCPDSGSAQVHFAASGWHGVEVFRAVDSWLSYLLDHHVFRVLFAFFEDGHRNAGRMARLMRFRPFAWSDGWVYSSRLRGA